MRRQGGKQRAHRETEFVIQELTDVNFLWDWAETSNQAGSARARGRHRPYCLPAGQSCALSPGDGADIKRSAIPCGEVIKDLFQLLVKIIRHTQLLFRGSA